MAVPESRIQAARRRLRVARYSIGAAAAAAFALFGVAARDAHPATHTGSTVAPTSAATAQSQSQSQEDSFSYDGGASIAPSSSNTPAVQSSGS